MLKQKRRRSEIGKEKKKWNWAEKRTRPATTQKPSLRPRGGSPPPQERREKKHLSIEKLPQPTPAASSRFCNFTLKRGGVERWDTGRGRVRLLHKCREIFPLAQRGRTDLHLICILRPRLSAERRVMWEDFKLVWGWREKKKKRRSKTAKHRFW